MLVAKLEDDFYANRHSCPGCGGALEEGNLQGAELSCPGCARRYDVRRAGRCLDDPQLHLEPIPLLVSEEVVFHRAGDDVRFRRVGPVSFKGVSRDVVVFEAARA